jgi:hypothetical protein
MKVIRCEVFSRVVGYFARIDNWNLGKREEFDDRKPFSLTVSLAHSDKRLEDPARLAAMRERLVEEGVLVG